MNPPFAAVYFDCDSTLSTIEGVDELLQWAPAGLRNEVRHLTEQAMNGTLPLAEVYATRLARLRPRREQLDQVGRLYCERLVADAALVVAALQHLGKQVGIVSGGLLPPVQHVARHLGVPLANVHAVPVQFDDAGDYVDFDHGSPLWHNGGKVTVVRALPATHRPVAFVGDGVTDLETQGHVDRFIGFGGVVARARVREQAECFVDAATLAAVVPFLTTDAERAQLAADRRFARLLSLPQP